MNYLQQQQQQQAPSASIINKLHSGFNCNSVLDRMAHPAGCCWRQLTALMNEHQMISINVAAVEYQNHRIKAHRRMTRMKPVRSVSELIFTFSLILLLISIGYLFTCTAASETSTTTAAVVGQWRTVTSNESNYAQQQEMAASEHMAATTTSTMTLAAGASVQHQRAALETSNRLGGETDLDNSISAHSSTGHSLGSLSRPLTNDEQQIEMAARAKVNKQRYDDNINQWTQQPMTATTTTKSNGIMHADNSFIVHQAPASSIVANQLSTHSKKGASAWQSQNFSKLMKYLSEHQQELVKANPGSILAVARGIKLAIYECQYQLKNEPWDCPIQGFSIRPSEVFGMLMSRSFKETSFVQALMSSAIAHAVARACTEGQITTCSRKKDPHDNDFAEDIDFGRQFAKRFMDVTHELQLYQQQQQQQQLNFDPDQRRRRATSSNSNGYQQHGGVEQQQLKHQTTTVTTTTTNMNHQPMWKERRLRYLINAHNDDVGLLTVYNGMMKECKCHGLSGACTMQTCWKRLPKFRDVANKLRDSFDQALRVEMYMAPQGNSLTMNRHKSLTSTTTMNGKSNKKRSSYTHQSSLVNKPLNGLGRSLSASKHANTIQAAALTSSASSMSDMSGGSSAGSRLQAFQQDAQSSGAQTQSKNSISNGESTGYLDNQSERELSYNSMYIPSISASPSINTTTILRRRPIARSIGPTATMMIPSKGDLLYAEESPDFCVPNARYNIKGTKGRICSENPHASNNCEKLCCGRGYKTEIREVGYPCNCNFKFCCDLHCQVCKRPKIEHKCL